MKVQARSLEARRPTASRQLLVAVGAVVIVVAVLLAAFVVALNRPPAAPAAGSPAAEVYGYLTAWDEGDLGAAYGYFSAAIQGE